MPSVQSLQNMKQGTVPTGYTLQREPYFEKFESEGAMVSGTLLKIETIEVNGKPTLRYVVDEGPDGITAFLATANLHTKLRREHIGCSVFVRFVGTNPNVVKNGNAMRMFDVGVRRPTGGTTPESNLRITDDDIGF